jgi:hypothetical protein
MNGLKPEPQGQMAVLENGAHADGEGLPAGVALTEANPSRFALKTANLGRIGVTAVWARRAIRPKLGFDVLESGFFVVEAIGGKNRLGHGLSPMAQILDIVVGMSSETSP